MKAIFYSVLLLLVGVVQTISAQEPYAALSEDNTVLTFYYDSQKADRNGMGVGPFGKKDQRGWDEMKSSITTVVFDPSFANKSDLTSTAFWFKGMGHLETITGIEYLKTDNVTDMTSMFADCRTLPSIDLSHFNTEKVESFYEMFEDCLGLTSLDVSHFNTENAKNMSLMFVACGNITSLDLRNFRTDNVTEMWSMFEDCKKIEKIDVTSFNTSNVKDMRYMFSDCFVIKELDLSNFNTQSATNMKCMFQDDYELKTIYVSYDWNTDMIEGDYGKRMFNECYKLVGGNGTKYDENHIDETYAHIDGGVSNPGYFTYKEKSSSDIHLLKIGAENNTYYDLQGRPVSQFSKGLYIKNGKKYIVK